MSGHILDVGERLEVDGFDVRLPLSWIEMDHDAVSVGDLRCADRSNELHLSEIVAEHHFEIEVVGDEGPID